MNQSNDKPSLSFYKKHKDSMDAYRRKVLRFTFQFSIHDTEAREWFEQQPEKGAYLKQLILEDKERTREDLLRPPVKNKSECEDKRMVGEYEIIHAVHVGAREIVVGVNAAQEYLCGFCTQNEILCSYTENVLSDDYLEIITVFTQRLDQQIQAAKAERKTIHVPVEPIAADQCFPFDEAVNITGKVVAVKVESLRYEYRRADRQILLVTGGFGAHGNSRGDSVYGINLFTGRNSGQWRRSDIMGEIRPENIPEWAKTRLKMFNQAATDRAELAKLLGISDTQMDYITNAQAGCGLIKVGGGIVPFVNEFPKDTALYKLMTTKPGEG